MKTAHRNLLVFTVLALLFVSCSIPKAETPTRVFQTETPRPSQATISTPTNIPDTLTPSLIVTMPAPTWIVDINPDLSVVYYSPNPVTDGKLELSVGSFDTL